MVSPELLKECIRAAAEYEASKSSVSPSSANSSDLSSSGVNAKTGIMSESSTTSSSPDPHAVSPDESTFYYAGFPSGPRLIYRTGKDQWKPPSGLEAQRQLKELLPVWGHPISEVWNDNLALKVVAILDAHKINFTTIDVVRIRPIESQVDLYDAGSKQESKDPVIIWIGVSPELPATIAHNASGDILALLKDFTIEDIDIHFRVSEHVRAAGPPLFEPVIYHPTADVLGPLIPALGLSISPKAAPTTQGTMALYLAEGGGSDRVLGLTSRHVLIGSDEPSTDYVKQPSEPRQDVLLLGKTAYDNLIRSIKVKIGNNALSIQVYETQIQLYNESTSTNQWDDMNPAKIEELIASLNRASDELAKLLARVEREWATEEDRILGHVLRAPAIKFGVGPHSFTEDWAIFEVDKSKLGPGFRGNVLDLGTNIPPSVFIRKCYSTVGAEWSFRYPGDRLLPLHSVLSDDLMRRPDMSDVNGKPCLFVVKNGSATGTTIGKANGLFSVVRSCFEGDASLTKTSMEWAVINEDPSGVFSACGDSGSIIADIRGRIGGLLTGGSGKTTSLDITYATPFWWLLERIHANGFPHAHLNANPASKPSAT